MADRQRTHWLKVIGHQVDTSDEAFLDEFRHDSSLANDEKFYLLRSEVIELLDSQVKLAREEERKLTVNAAKRAAYERFRDEIERLSHPQVEVLCHKDDIRYVRMIEDVEFAGNFIRVTITPSVEDTVTDLATNSPNANTDLSNPQEQRIAEYKQLLDSLPEYKPDLRGTKFREYHGFNDCLDQCRAIILKHIKEME